ncbi:MAG: ABC transporter permease [Eubacteriales bacterium]|nr:ABC transporter permease [Eubacteriales bacterium]
MQEKKTRHSVRLLTGIVFPLVILLVWYLVTASGNTSEMLLPRPVSIWNAFVKYISDGTLTKDIGVSLLRVVRGYLSGAILGILFGLLMGIFTPVNHFFAPTLNALRQIAPLAWIPLLMLWFGIGDLSKEVLIAMGTFYQTMLNTISGLRGIPKGYIEFAKNYKIRKFDILRKILIPGAAPSILVGLRLGASSAWMAILAAEMIAATSGVGYRISSARNLMETDVVILYMIIIGIIGGVMDWVIRKLAARLVNWQER